MQLNGYTQYLYENGTENAATSFYYPTSTLHKVFYNGLDSEITQTSFISFLQNFRNDEIIEVYYQVDDLLSPKVFRTSKRIEFFANSVHNDITTEAL